MADINVDELGPVDYVVVGFPADKADFSGAMADELKNLMESGTVRVLDLLLVTKDEDGTVSVAELRDHDDSLVGELRSLEADLSLMLAVEDVERIGGDLELGSAAAVLVWENTWAAPFASAVRHSGGELLAMGRIPTQALIAAAEEDREAAEAEV
jgi:fructosamine-3-kinase